MSHYLFVQMAYFNQTKIVGFLCKFTDLPNYGREAETTKIFVMALKRSDFKVQLRGV